MPLLSYNFLYNVFFLELLFGSIFFYLFLFVSFEMCEKVYCLRFSALQFYFVSIPKNSWVSINDSDYYGISQQLRMPL